jgi:hypothetical protein
MIIPPCLSLKLSATKKICMSLWLAQLVQRVCGVDIDPHRARVHAAITCGFILFILDCVPVGIVVNEENWAMACRNRTWVVDDLRELWVRVVARARSMLASLKRKEF